MSKKERKRERESGRERKKHTNRWGEAFSPTFILYQANGKPT